MSESFQFCVGKKNENFSKQSKIHPQEIKLFHWLIFFLQTEVKSGILKKRGDD